MALALLHRSPKEQDTQTSLSDIVPRYKGNRTRHAYDDGECEGETDVKSFPPFGKENVRIQCKIEGFVAYRLSLRKPGTAFSLAVNIPRIPLPSHQLAHLKYYQYFRVEVCPNGLARSLHCYWDEISECKRAERDAIAQEFMVETFRESEPGVPVYVMSIVHSAAHYLPDLLEYMCNVHPNLTVKAGSLSGLEFNSMLMKDYYAKVSTLAMAQCKPEI